MEPPQWVPWPCSSVSSDSARYSATFLCVLLLNIAFPRLSVPQPLLVPPVETINPESNQTGEVGRYTFACPSGKLGIDWLIKKRSPYSDTHMTYQSYHQSCDQDQTALALYNGVACQSMLSGD